MNKEIIQSAINSAISLLYNELDVIEVEDLRAEFITVIEGLETALIEINKDE